VSSKFILPHEGTLGSEVLGRFFHEHCLDHSGLARAHAGMGELLSRQAELFSERYSGRGRLFPGADETLWPAWAGGDGYRPGDQLPPSLGAMLFG
jgi:hypothetical protein